MNSTTIAVTTFIGIILSVFGSPIGYPIIVTCAGIYIVKELLSYNK